MKTIGKIFSVIATCCTVNFAHANDDSFMIIRDAEIEDVLTDMAKKVFKVAKLNPKSAHVYVIDSATINAFTIGDGYIFITSGLLLKYDNPLHILAIMCHEIGHIAAGHVDRKISAMKSSSKRLGIAALASIIGGALTGSGDAAALLLGYAMTDAQFYLRFSRSEEFAADALAASYLKQLGFGADLLIESFNVFKRMDLLNSMNNLPTYMSTHPKTDDRINALNKWRTHKHYIDENLSNKYRPIITKIKSCSQTGFVNYPTADLYTQAIHLQKIGKISDAISLLRKLILSSKNNFYYKETLAQMLHENGQLEESSKEYEKIYSPQINNIIKIDYAAVLLELAEQKVKNRQKHVRNALKIIENLQYEIQVDSDVFRLLGKAYGLLEDKGMATYFVGREQMVLQNYDLALKLLSTSLSLLPKNSPAHKTAKYLVELIKSKKN